MLGAGRLLGGSVGVGTVLYALAVGPITQLFMPRFAYGRGGGAGAGDAPARESRNPLLRR